MTWEWTTLILGVLLFGLGYNEQRLKHTGNEDTIDDLSERVVGLQISMNEFQEIAKTAAKQSDETKKLLSELNLAKSLRVSR